MLYYEWRKKMKTKIFILITLITLILLSSCTHNVDYGKVMQTNGLLNQYEQEWPQ